MSSITELVDKAGKLVNIDCSRIVSAIASEVTRGDPLRFKWLNCCLCISFRVAIQKLQAFNVLSAFPSGAS
ncbi:hypothetical protein H6F90_20540 [Trichocoleus sp. FACHB-591]|uniref:hypothetical protein n=1 Tax=Trichocoleus sp. FACHB-591 TaxID=2692872 RepID=UPI00168334E5|nr:hypothetical protein [Trichocoleus sp. FACHB-591]MBD2097489.1 hypothetical protein [Trichocoleus sp. FACHB-591]